MLRRFPLLLLALLAACSGPASPSQTPPPPTGTASTAALAAVINAAEGAGHETSKYTVAIIGADYFGGNATGTGSYDFTAYRGTMTLELGQESGSASEPVVFTPLTAYFHPPASVAKTLHLPASSPSPWVLADFSSPAELSQNFPGLLLQMETINPGFILNELLNGAISASPALATGAGGHYFVTVRPTQASQEASGVAATAIHNATGPLTHAMTIANPHTVNYPTTTMEVWVDASGRLTEVKIPAIIPSIGAITLKLTPGTAGAATTVPPSSQVVDLGTLGAHAEKEVTPGKDGDAS